MATKQTTPRKFIIEDGLEIEVGSKEYMWWKHQRYRLYGQDPTSHAPHPKHTHAQEATIFWHWGIAHKGQIHYAEVRPIPISPVGHLPSLPFTTDCSGFFTMGCRYGGFPDPNHQGYNGEGYTGTLLAHGEHVSINDVGKDLKSVYAAVYGCKSIPDGHHVGAVIAVHAHTFAGILTASHGNEAGPYAITVADEAKYQPDGEAGVVFLRFKP